MKVKAGRKLRWIKYLLVVWVLISGGSGLFAEELAPLGANLLESPGFEGGNVGSPPPRWIEWKRNPSTFAMAEGGHSGRQCAVLTLVKNEACAFVLADQRVSAALREGQRYRASVWVKAEKPVYVTLRFYAGTVTKGDSPAMEVGARGDMTVPQAWTQITAELDIPELTTGESPYLRFALALDAGYGADGFTILLDDAEIVRIEDKGESESRAGTNEERAASISDSAAPATLAPGDGINHVRNSGFECSTAGWMPMDGWLPSAVYDCPEGLVRKPDIFKDGLAGETLPDPAKQRTPSEKYEGEYSCVLDAWYETAYSAYMNLDTPAVYTFSAWMKSTHPDTEVRAAVVSAQWRGEDADKPMVETFKIGTDWQRYWFSVSLPEDANSLHQVYFHLPLRRGGDPISAVDKFGQKVDLRLRTNKEKVFVDAVQLEKGRLTDYKPASPVEVGARFLDTEDWVFVDGETPVLEIQSASPGIKEFRVLVSDWRRQVLWEKSVPVSKERAANGIPVPVDVNQYGYFRAFVSARNETDKVSREVELPFGIIPSRPREGSFENSPFGGMFAVDRHWQAVWHKPGCHTSIYELDERLIKTAAKIGMRWAKTMDWIQFTTWVATEPEKGVFQWGDPGVRLLKKYGFNIYGKLVYVPSFAQGEVKDFHTGPPGDLEAWDNYVRRSLEHYRGELEITHWNVWAEIFSSYFWRGSAQEYVNLLKRTYEIARSVDPAVKIGSVNGCSPYYKYQTPGVVEDAFRLGAMKYCDFFTYHRPHDYGDRPGMSDMPLETKPDWAEDIRVLQGWMERYGGQKRPIWNTELRLWTGTGYLDRDRFANLVDPSIGDDLILSLEDSIAFVVRSHVVSLSSGVERLFVFGLGSCGLNYDMTGVQYMQEADGRPKPWMLSYAAMTYLLEGASPQGQIALADKRVSCHAFQKGKDTIVVAWGLNTIPESLRQDGPGDLHIPNAACKVMDIMGNEMNGQSKEVVVPLRSEPYYLVFKNTGLEKAKSILQQAKVTWHRMY